MIKAKIIYISLLILFIFTFYFLHEWINHTEYNYVAKKTLKLYYKLLNLCFADLKTITINRVPLICWGNSSTIRLLVKKTQLEKDLRFPMTLAPF